MSAAAYVVGDDLLEWCVERSSGLCAMTWGELWTAIADGEVRRGTRVWREGLECWTPVEGVPELTGAFSSLATLEFENAFGNAATPPAVEIATLPPMDTTPTAPIPPVLPAASVRPLAWEPERPRSSAPARVGARSFIARLVSDLVNARWTAAGMVVAAVAIGASLSSVSAPPHRDALGRARFRSLATSDVVRLVSASMSSSSASVMGLSKSEPGQRRLRSGRRALSNTR